MLGEGRAQTVQKAPFFCGLWPRVLKLVSQGHCCGVSKPEEHWPPRPQGVCPLGPSMLPPTVLVELRCSRSCALVTRRAGKFRVDRSWKTCSGRVSGGAAGAGWGWGNLIPLLGHLSTSELPTLRCQFIIDCFWGQMEGSRRPCYF